jgi:hypothetical protein
LLDALARADYRQGVPLFIPGDAMAIYLCPYCADSFEAVSGENIERCGKCKNPVNLSLAQRLAESPKVPKASQEPEAPPVALEFLPTVQSRAQREILPESHYGLASYIMAFVNCTWILLFGFLFIVELARTSGRLSIGNPAAGALATTIVTGLIMGVVGLGMGFAARFQTDRSHRAGDYGVIGNAIPVGLAIILIIASYIVANS